MPRKRPDWAPWLPIEYTAFDVSSLQALQRGDASADQQRQALRWIVESAGGAYLETFHPEDARWSDFAQGRRFVGTQIIKLLNISLMDVVNAERKKRGSPPKESEQPP